MHSTLGGTRRAQTAVESATSWSDHIRAIEAEKRTLSWQPGDVAPLVRVSMLDRKTKERELDPIVMAFRSPEREAEHAAKRLQRTQTQPLQRLENIRQTNFNIVSHEGGPPPRILAVRQDLEEKRTNSGQGHGWHLLSHLAPKEHVECPTLFDEKYMESNVRRKENSWVPKKQPREFNIISNQFRNNHEERLHEEYNNTKQIMVKKYWDTHKFDIIRQEHYDDAKEYSERERELQASLVHGQAQVAKLPTSFKYAEGRSYDILNHEVKDADLIKISLKKGTQEMNRLTKFKDVPRQQLEAGKHEYDKWQERHMQRVSFKRWEEQLDRGYDFVHTKLLDPNLVPLPARTPPMWARLSTAAAGIGGGSSNSTGEFNSTSGGWSSTTGGDGVSGRGGWGSARGAGLAAVPISARPNTNSEKASQPSSRAGVVPGLDMRSVRTGGLSEYQ